MSEIVLWLNKRLPAEILKLLPTDDEKTNLRKSIEALAVASMLRVGEVKITTPPAAAAARGPAGKPGFAPPVPVTFTFDVFGKLDGMLSFIDRVENYNERVMSVNNISFKPGDVAMPAKGNLPDFKDHTIKIEILAYFMPEGATR